MCRRHVRVKSMCLAIVVIAGTALAGCGSSTSNAASGPSGPPIRLMVETPLTSPVGVFPEIPPGARAAAAAINRAGGVEGRPIKIDVCDDQQNPNTATQCAQQAVANHELAMVGTDTGQGGSYMPILQAAGIPSVGNAVASTAEATSPLSFPIVGASIGETAALGGFCGKVGGRRPTTAYIDLATAKGLVDNFVGRLTASFGHHLAAEVAIPGSAVDMDTYAAALSANDATCMSLILATTQTALMLRSLSTTPSHALVITPTFVFGPSELATVSDPSKNVYLVGSYPPIDDNANPGISQFNKELDAYGDKTDHRDEAMVSAWASVHIVANLAAHLTTINSSNLVQAMRTAGTINFGPVPPFNWADPSPFFGGLRVFDTLVTFSQLVNGKAVPLFGGKPIDYTTMAGASLP